MRQRKKSPLMLEDDVIREKCLANQKSLYTKRRPFEQKL